MPPSSRNRRPHQPDIVYEFEDEPDAIEYLGELARLWVAWLVGLTGLAITDPLLLIAWAAIVLFVLVLMVRPLQRRGEKLVPDGTAVPDRVITTLAFGAAPLRAALRTTGASERWMIIRYVVIGLTVVALLYGVATTMP